MLLNGFFTSGGYAVDAAKEIKIFLKDIQNPNSVRTSTQGITLQILSSADELSQQNDYSTTLKCSSSTAESILIKDDTMTPFPNTRIVNTAMNYYYFQFTPKLSFDSTAIIELVLPEGLTFDPVGVMTTKLIGQT